MFKTGNMVIEIKNSMDWLNNSLDVVEERKTKNCKVNQRTERD
jgi:hypothetical protein